MWRLEQLPVGENELCGGESRERIKEDHENNDNVLVMNSNKDGTAERKYWAKKHLEKEQI